MLGSGMRKFLDTLSRAVLSTKFLGMAGTTVTLASQGMYAEMAQVVMAWLVAQGAADAGKAMGKPAGVGHKD